MDVIKWSSPSIKYFDMIDLYWSNYPIDDLLVNLKTIKVTPKSLVVNKNIVLDKAKSCEINAQYLIEGMQLPNIEKLVLILENEDSIEHIPLPTSIKKLYANEWKDNIDISHLINLVKIKIRGSRYKNLLGDISERSVTFGPSYQNLISLTLENFKNIYINFQGMPNLECLWIEGLYDAVSSGITHESFVSCTNLRYMTILNQPLLIHPIVSQMKMLETLHIEKCGLLNIDRDVYRGLDRLRVLVLDVMTISHPDVFEGLLSLENISLPKSLESNCTDGLFANLQSLTRVRFS